MQQKKDKKGLCGICSAGCWVIASYGPDGRLNKLRPDTESPMGMICRLGEHAPEILYSPDRLLHPLRRKGPKGTYDFERITWEQAYEAIVANLQSVKDRHGPEAVAIYTGVGTFELSLCDVFQPKGVAVSSASSVLFPFGSPNTMGVGALCYTSYGMMAPHLCTGRILNEMFNDIENSEMVVIWGTNPATDLPPIEMRRVAEASRRGVPVVVIDPRRTPAARLPGARWVPIRPGTDGALALGLCNVLIEEELYDETFARDWTHGFEDFERLLQHYRPEAVQAITGVPRETVVSLARGLASSKGVSQLMYTGLEYSGHGVQAIRASLALWALAGQLDVPGGRCFTMPDAAFPINRSGLVANPDTGPRLGRDRFPLYIKYRDEAHATALPGSVLEGKPYRIRSMIIQGGSLCTSWPGPELWKKTLAALEFLLCIDRQFTADAAYADIVLPASTYFETRSYMTYGPVFKIREPMVEPLGQSRGDFAIMAELAQRLGYGELYPQNDKALLRHVLSGSGFTYEQVVEAGGSVSAETKMMQYKKWEKGLLRPDGKPGFDTPTGKFEIHSTVLEEFGYDPLPIYTEPSESPLSAPDAAGKYPLVLTSGSRSSSSFHTQHIGNPGLNKNRPEPSVLISPGDADKRGIRHGDRVRLSTQRGSVLMRAKVTEDIMPGVVDAEHAGGGPLGPEAWQNANVNTLTDIHQCDPISGFPASKALLCEVSLAGDASRPLSMKEEPMPESVIAEDAGGNGPRPPLMEVYLDNNATTEPAPEVVSFMQEIAGVFGNPSSIHSSGRAARGIIEQARLHIATALGTTARRIVFTGSGSEANNLAIKGIMLSPPKTQAGSHIITSSVEHPSVLELCRWLQSNGVDVTYVPVDQYGMVDPKDVKEALRPGTALISIMLANNETGTIQPIPEIAAIAREAGVPMHTDAVQGFGKIPVNVEQLGVDMLSVSGHKVHGPKGVGALFVRKGMELAPLIHGGPQEHGLRAGTENTLSVAGFGKAAQMVPLWLKDSDNVAALRDTLHEGLKDIIPGLRRNSHPERCLPNTLNVTLPGLRGESLVLGLDRLGVYVSSGSACKSGSPAPSHALLAMGLSEQDAHCSLRFSLNRSTNYDKIQYTLQSLGDVLEKSKSLVHFVPCR